MLQLDNCLMSACGNVSVMDVCACTCRGGLVEGVGHASIALSLTTRLF